MLAQPIEPADTYETLAPRLATLGSHAVLHSLNNLSALRASSSPQPSAGSSSSSSFPIAPKLPNTAGFLDLSLPAAALYHRYRACKGYLNLYTTYKQQRLNLAQVDGLDGTVSADGVGVVTWHRERRLLRVECGDGRGLWVAALQLANKSVTDAASFANGYLLNASTGMRFGDAGPADAQQASSSNHLRDSSAQAVDTAA